MNNLTTETILCKLVLGKQYCLVVIDAFTKFVWTETLATKESKGVCESLLKIFKPGEIEILQADNGGEFTSEQFEKVFFHLLIFDN